MQPVLNFCYWYIVDYIVFMGVLFIKLSNGYTGIMKIDGNWYYYLFHVNIRGEKKDYEYHNRTNTGYLNTNFLTNAKQSQRLAEINIINF